MAKSQQTFNKSEKEKKRLKKREEKRKKMAARKAEAKENGKKGIQFAYVDHNGNLTDTPPDPSQKVAYEIENIEISIPKTLEGEKEEVDPVRKGKVSFFDSSKGFGFIIDAENNEKYFTHVSGIIDTIVENDKVSFELEMGKKGMNAVKVTLIKE
ncbi:cold shock domain-containing protein [Kordia algicida OT-1]|uniref:CSD domain-containing protein n=1 Tax=Kordia algicida OT-1 TaxID=391587 RepID=A9E0P0_9FLAO|nr:cold shock domain-containing protein [Kordia algicida]EDP95909.1 hypothetical protein KAOT1_05877 [Kordia algicida OT-1]